LDIVKKGWLSKVDGVHQFCVIKKLRLLKSPLHSLLFKQGNLHKNVEVLRIQLEGIQKSIDDNPDDLDLRSRESSTTRLYAEACLDEERFLKQKSKAHWLAVGDSNTAYFHRSLKARNQRSRIDVVHDSLGVLHEGHSIPVSFVQHYEDFLGHAGNGSLIPPNDLFLNRLSASKADYMLHPVLDLEVKEAMFSIGDNKAPGPDGYSTAFFKKAWPIFGKDIRLAIQDFFKTGRLLHELNHTIIALVPKVLTPSCVTDFRPIACCNVLYKCITKIISDRIKDSLSDIVGINQSAFVPGLLISDNILLT
jgi:hypothetical protein